MTSEQKKSLLRLVYILLRVLSALFCRKMRERSEKDNQTEKDHEPEKTLPFGKE
jgi:hypothetical protein